MCYLTLGTVFRYEQLATGNSVRLNYISCENILLLGTVCKFKLLDPRNSLQI